MLKSLSIRNYALIDSLEIDFFEDLNILTGETGAGKSILLGAIGLISGQRADSSVLRDKSEKCTVEGVFDVTNYHLQDFFSANDLDYEEVTILRREITPQGKSRAFINDTPVTVKVLNDLGLLLIDIHSQHQNLELNEKKYQLQLVDLVAGNSALILEYGQAFKRYLALNEKLGETVSLATQAKKDFDYYQFQFNQLEGAKLSEDEQTELEGLLEKLTHAEEIRMTFGQIFQRFDEGEPSVLSVLKESLSSLSKLRTVLPEAEQMHQRLESVYLEVKDIALESSSISEKTENNPEQIAKVGERLDLIYSLQQKHRVNSVKELLSLQMEFASKIEQVGSYEFDIDVIKRELGAVSSVLKTISGKITDARKAAAPSMERKVVEVLRNLGIPSAMFQVKFGSLDHFTPTGTDEVSFLFSANKSQEMQEIGKIASGGEISRFMLAVKTLINDARALPTIIFDEIDTGVSGEVAVKMGQILKQMAGTMQVLNITHLPQIAAKGKHHYKVFKYERSNQTYTSIRKLTEAERVEEIAQMLSGENYSSTAEQAAQELLQS